MLLLNSLAIVVSRLEFNDDRLIPALLEPVLTRLVDIQFSYKPGSKPSHVSEDSPTKPRLKAKARGQEQGKDDREDEEDAEG